MARFRYEVTRCAPDEEHAVITSLARAFHDDPLFNFCFPTTSSRRVACSASCRRTSRTRSRSGRSGSRAGRSDAVAGAAVWLPPGAYPRGTRRDLGQLARMMPGSGTGIGPRVPAVMRLLRRIDEVHPPERQWYLAVLGVDPLFQRTGAVARCSNRCSRSLRHRGALPAYLETQKPENVPYYRTFGFELVQELDVRGCPPLWTMTRPPRPEGVTTPATAQAAPTPSRRRAARPAHSRSSP